MASRLEKVDEEYIEELRAKGENEEQQEVVKDVLKSGRMKETCKQI